MVGVAKFNYFKSYLFTFLVHLKILYYIKITSFLLWFYTIIIFNLINSANSNKSSTVLWVDIVHWLSKFSGDTNQSRAKLWNILRFLSASLFLSVSSRSPALNLLALSLSFAFAFAFALLYLVQCVQLCLDIISCRCCHRLSSSSLPKNNTQSRL